MIVAIFLYSTCSSTENDFPCAPYIVPLPLHNAVFDVVSQLVTTVVVIDRHSQEFLRPETTMAYPNDAGGGWKSQDAEMRALFAALDKDKNGYIDKHELRITMLEVGLDLSEDDLDTMMKAAGVVIKDRIFYEGMT